MSAQQFRVGLDRFKVTTKTRAQIVFDGASRAALASIRLGSPITGAPGQPVDSEDLLKSWRMEPESPTVNVIFTDSPYAQSNEDGIARPGGGPYILRSKRGGRHSVKLTIMGFPRIVADIVAKLGTRFPGGG